MCLGTEGNGNIDGISNLSANAPRFRSTVCLSAKLGLAFFRNCPMNILLWCDDLLTRTRLESAWKAAGAVLLRKISAEKPDCIVMDLTARDAITQIAALREKHHEVIIVAFGPHGDCAAFKAARAAGASEASTRSAIVDRILAKLRGGD